MRTIWENVEIINARLAESRASVLVYRAACTKGQSAQDPAAGDRQRDTSDPRAAA